MEYMEAQMQTAMMAAEETYRRDALFRHVVEQAVHQAMRHFLHFDRTKGDEIEPRDVHHVAVSAALAALHLSVESDTMLKALTEERDRYKKLAEESLTMRSPLTVFKPL